MKSKYVRNYHWTEFGGGIIQLTFNTYERWIEYHQLSDEWYEFEGLEGPLEEELIEIEYPEVLNNNRYLTYSLQEKDQIYFIYIPFSFFEDRNDTLLEGTLKVLKNVNGDFCN